MQRRAYPSRSGQDEIYFGDFVDGKRHGRVLLTSANVAGARARASMLLQGTYTYSDGSKFDGEWNLDVVDGDGRCTFASGNVYEGQWSAADLR